MKERPILFNGEMVRAILDGRKTQTRRVIRLPEIVRGETSDETSIDACSHQIRAWMTEYPEEGSIALRCPFGQPGDRLWVRETWARWGCLQHEGGLSSLEAECSCGRFCYRTDGEDEDIQRWRPSIHMPRWASRITLEITNVRVERLQDINHKDCEAEGLVHGARAMWSCPGTTQIFQEGCHGFGWLWESINGEGSWAANPWVWVVEFKKV